MSNSITLEDSISAQKSVQIPSSSSGVAGQHKPQGTVPTASKDKSGSKGEKI